MKHLFKIKDYLTSCFVFIVIAGSFVISYGNIFNNKVKLLNSLPKLNFGLDISGGTRFVLKVNFDDFFHDKYLSFIDPLKKEMWQHDIECKSIDVNNSGILIGFKNKESLVSFQNQSFVALGSDCESIQNSNLSLNVRFSNEEKIKESVMRNIFPVLSKRIDNFGLRDISITRYDRDKIVILIPKGIDTDKIKQIVTKIAKLTFHLIDYGHDGDVLNLEMKDFPGSFVPLVKVPAMSGDLIEDARPISDENGNVVFFQLNKRGARIFKEITESNQGKHLAIVMDGKIVSLPMINTVIKNGNCVISGKFTKEELMSLATLLKSGSVEASLDVIEERVINKEISPVLRKSIVHALTLAFILISLLMLYKYKIFGLISIFCLFLNALFTIAISSIIQATVSIPSLVSFVLTLGIVIDANILTFERIKDLSKSGQVHTGILKKSFDDVSKTILDSNLTTIFACIALVVTGFGFIKSFGILLIIGVINSFFTNVYLTKKIIIYISNSRFKKLFYVI